MVVSNVLPFQILAEYPKNCTTNRAVQKIPSPRQIRFPKAVFKSSAEDVRQSRPIKKTTNAIKKE